MGFGELTEWVIGKIKLTNHKRNEKFGSNPFGRRRIYIIPLYSRSEGPFGPKKPPFHYSMCEARLPSLSKYL